MNRLTKYLTGAIIILSIATINIQAEDSANRSPKAASHKHHPDKDRVEFLAKKLNLTEEQKAQVKSIMDSAEPKLKAIQENAKQQSKLVQEEVRQSIESILSDEQKNAYDQIQQRKEELISKKKQQWKENK